MQKFQKWLEPAKAIDSIPTSEIPNLYQKLRYQVLEATFLGYTTYYLVRNNFSPVSKEMGESLSYSRDEIGSILAVSAFCYGIGKFIMGAISDRSDARKFMALGLLLTGIINIIFGSVAGIQIHIFLWGLNGLVQGMGWPPCGRTLGHWYSVSERGTVFAIWNISHNIGGGIVGILAAYAASFFGWQAAFYIPGIIALLMSYYLLLRLKDTPQSVGLPPIEVYKNDFANTENHQIQKESIEVELSFKQLLLQNVLLNKYIWLFALINFFVYVVRYSLIDWGPTYLKETKGANLTSGGQSTLIFEFAGIFSTLAVGWASDKVGGRRGMVSLLCLLPILFAFFGILWNPPGRLWLDFFLFGVIGLFVYPPVMLLGVAGLDFTSKKAVGTAAGFIGLFGSLGRTAESKLLGWIVTNYSWDLAIQTILASTFIAIALLATTWNLKPKS